MYGSRSSKVSMVGFLTVCVMIPGWVCTDAADEPLLADRPDFTEGSSTVGRGVFQLEGGVTFANYPSDVNVTTVGEILARWGLAEQGAGRGAR